MGGNYSPGVLCIKKGGQINPDKSNRSRGALSRRITFEGTGGETGSTVEEVSGNDSH